MTTTEAPITAAPVTQLSRRGVLAVWAAAALPMAALSWIVAPVVSHHVDGPSPLIRSLLVCMTIGLVWQGVLVAVLVRRERGSLRWSEVKDALWLHRPRSPRTGRAGGKVWWVLVPLIVGFALEDMVPSAVPDSRNFAEFLGSDAAEQLFHGAWGWFGLMVVLTVFNTVLGEELLFRGYLLPRMEGAFGRGDWAVNGVLFATYHLHMPWAIPAALLDMFWISYPSKRYRSAWIGIAVHSAQTVVILLGMLVLVL